MIKFEHQGRKYRLGFKHTNDSMDPLVNGEDFPKGSAARREIHRFNDKHGIPRAKTRAILQEQRVISESVAEWVTIADAWSTCSWFDNFNRKDGRERSLKRLVAQVAGVNGPLAGAIYVAYNANSRRRGAKAPAGGHQLAQAGN